MTGLGVALLAVGLIVNLICSFAIIVKAFQASVWWGLGSLLVPFVALIFIVTHWDDTKKPFLWSLASLAPVFIGVLMLPNAEPKPAAEAVAQAPRRNPIASKLAYDPDPAEPVTSRPTPTATTATAPPRAPAQQASMIQMTGSIERVYVDNESKLFYAEDCRTRPESAYRMSRKLAISQGFKEGTCRR